MGSTHEAIDLLFSDSPYGLSEIDKRNLLLRALNDSYLHHVTACPAYRKFCARRNLDEKSSFSAFEDFPFLPVQAFKENSELLRSTSIESIKIKLQSSATSGVPSTVLVDGITAKRQVRALAAVVAEVLGPKRRPFAVLDIDPNSHGSSALGARGAAVRGFLNLAREAEYFIRPHEGGLELISDKFIEALARYKAKGEPIIVLGFTYVLYLHVVHKLKSEGKSFELPQGSFVIHIGGWKKLEDQKVNKAVFNRDVADIFGIPESHVIDFYGFTEQMGVTYPDNAHGNKQTPSFSEVIVRDPVTLKPVPDGQIGVLQFLSPVPHSYPGFSVLTDDLGVIVSRNDASLPWNGTEFRVVGRAKNAEVRGCGDIMGEKLQRVRPPKNIAVDRQTGTSDIRLLFGNGRAFTSTTDLNAPVDLQSLPTVTDLSLLALELKKARAVLDQYSVDDLIALVGEAARRWNLPDSPLAPMRQSGLQFLTQWCLPTSFRDGLDRSLHAGRGVLDGFRKAGGRNLMAQPRGLVCHWLSGNVPLLGMLTLAQSIVTRNANMLKVSSTFSSMMPILLDTFRNIQLTVAGGRILDGNDILKTIAVIYYPREDFAAAEAFSRAADVRLAWGGREAVEAVMNLPRRYGTEDIIFGPKLSYMAIGKEALDSERSLHRTARQAAIDASVFDQYACASPHVIFVEKGGGAASPEMFAERLSVEMAKTAIRIPKQLPDAGTVSNINRLRIRYELTGSLWASAGTEWTVLFDEEAGVSLPDPCYSRVITVRAIDNILDSALFAHPGIQTIGLALEGARRLDFAQTASALGAERFPDIGRMTYFDNPWDGIFTPDRLIRWISLGGPL